MAIGSAVFATARHSGSDQRGAARSRRATSTGTSAIAPSPTAICSAKRPTMPEPAAARAAMPASRIACLTMSLIVTRPLRIATTSGSSTVACAVTSVKPVPTSTTPSSIWSS